MNNVKNTMVRPKDRTMAMLEEKARWVWRETLRIHGTAQGTRLASSLSCIEIFVVLYYGRIIAYNPKDRYWERRDRLVISKSHGAVSLYPILADLRYLPAEELGRVCKQGGLLNDIPDSNIPGFETVNGSLGHGLGVACGISTALKMKKRDEKVFVLSGDGELYEGSVWEAIMWAGHRGLGNMILIVDNNRMSMLGYCRDILDLDPLDRKFRAFGWKTKKVDGHDLDRLYRTLWTFKKDRTDRPKVVIADTVKGKGIPGLEADPLCHIKTVSKEEIDILLTEKR